MNDTLPPPSHAADAPRVSRRSIARLIAPLDELAERSPNFLSRPFGEFDSDGRRYELPRYVYLGPKGGGETLRLGLFATVHGDEPEGALGLTRFIERLEQTPEIAKGYTLFLYPVCNPTGFEDASRQSRRGRDLNREFWTDSAEPEVGYLETEIWTHAFHGLVMLHSDDTSDGLYGFVNGAVLSEHLLEPALREAARFLPRNTRRRIDGFAARRGIIGQSYPGVLRAVPGMAAPPFEITFETPQRAPLHLQVAAVEAALGTILTEFRYLMAIAQNI
jgi:hypothetical protein